MRLFDFSRSTVSFVEVFQTFGAQCKHHFLAELSVRRIAPEISVPVSTAEWSTLFANRKEP